MHNLEVFLEDIANLITNSLEKKNSGVKGFAKLVNADTNDFYVGLESNRLTMLTLSEDQSTLSETVFDKVSQYVGISKERINEIVEAYMEKTSFEYISRIAVCSGTVIYEEHDSMFQFGVSELTPHLSTQRVQIKHSANKDTVDLTITYGDAEMEDDVFEQLSKTRKAVINFINNEWRDPDKRQDLKSYVCELEIAANYTIGVDDLTDTGVKNIVGNWTYLGLSSVKVVYENKDWELPTIKHYLESLEK